MPRVAGLTRLAQVPPVGFVLDRTLGWLARPVTRRVQWMVSERVQALRRR